MALLLWASTFWWLDSFDGASRASAVLEGEKASLRRRGTERDRVSVARHFQILEIPGGVVAATSNGRDLLALTVGFSPRHINSVVKIERSCYADFRQSGTLRRGSR